MSSPPVEAAPAAQAVPTADTVDGGPHRRWLWAAGVLVGLLVLGPGLLPGSLLSLDLLVTPHIPIPNGLFGLGPALSQRVPSFAVLAMASAVVGGPLATKAAIVAMVAAGFVGAARLTGAHSSPLTQAAAGVLWAAGPFALTRVGVGHLNVTWAVATLPWALPRLCRPSEAPWSTFLAAGLLAFGGPASGTLGVTVALVSLVVERGRRPVTVVAAVVAPNLVWVLPTAVLLWAGAGVTGAGGFATHPGGVAGWPGVLAGNGFWRADFQVGATGWFGGAVGLGIGALAVVGWGELDRRWARPASVVAATGLVLAVASAVPGVRDGYRWASNLPIGAPLRESQRFLALWLVAAVPAAACGAAVLGRRLGAAQIGVRPAGSSGRPLRASDRACRVGRADQSDRAVNLLANPLALLAIGTSRVRTLAPVVAALPLAVGLAVAIPGWWGIKGRLEPVEFPAGWAVARHELRARPGPTVAFPWAEYPVVGFAAGRQVFNPVPDYLGGDVISSFDPLFDRSRPHQEQVDRRAVVVDRLVRRVRAGFPISARLADLGIRWVVLVDPPGADRYHSLPADPGLDRVVHLSDVDLYEVSAWAGPATDPRGGRHELRRPVPPLLRTEAPRGSVLDVAGAPGWVQGWGTPVRVTADGRLRLPGSSDTVWFWPAPALLAVDLTLATAAAIAYRRRSRSSMTRTANTCVATDGDLRFPRRHRVWTCNR